jgi:hypothetical protein
MADQRILQGRPATLRASFADQDGNTVTPSGAVSVRVQRADGTDVVAAGTATGSEGNERTVALTGAQTAQLDFLTATWTDAGNSTTTTTLVEVVGGYWFTIAEARQQPGLDDTGKVPDALIVDRRAFVENEAEWITDVAWVPRYRRVALDGDGSNRLILPNGRVRTVRSLRTYTTPSIYTAFSSTQLTALAYSDAVVFRTDGLAFPDGLGNVVVEYEHGNDRPPVDLKDAALLRLRALINADRSGIPLRAKTWQAAEGGTFALDQPDAYKTGIGEVDAVYTRYSRRSRGDTPVPVSRNFDFDPRRQSLYHGGRR